jgi:ribonuclease R
MKRGALDFELPEAKVVLDAQTREPTDVARRADDPGVKRAYQLIEELMLLANEVVARWCEQRELATIYRVHGAPDEQKLERFASMCETLGIPFDAEDARDPKRLGELLKSFADHPLAPVLNSLLLRSMKQATYDVTNVGHFGLASKAYLHFTSPIRRYPDLVVHRVVHGVLGGHAQRPSAREQLAEIAFTSSAAERRAMEVERAVVDLYRTVVMRERLGERFEGTVTAVVGSGVFVQLDAPFVDVLVRLEDLGHDRWEIDDDTLRAVAVRSGDVVALGDRMTVEIIDVSILRRATYGKRASGNDGLTTPARKREPIQSNGKSEPRSRAKRDSKRGHLEAKTGGPRPARPGKAGPSPDRRPTKGKKKKGPKAPKGRRR